MIKKISIFTIIVMIFIMIVIPVIPVSALELSGSDMQFLLNQLSDAEVAGIKDYLGISGRAVNVLTRWRSNPGMIEIHLTNPDSQTHYSYISTNPRSIWFPSYGFKYARIYYQHSSFTIEYLTYSSSSVWYQDGTTDTSFYSNFTLKDYNGDAIDTTGMISNSLMFFFPQPHLLRQPPILASLQSLPAALPTQTLVVVGVGILSSMVLLAFLPRFLNRFLRH